MKRPLPVILVFCLLLAAGGSLRAIEPGMPNPPASPTIVTVGIFVADIIRVSEVDQTFEAELIYYASWEDPRLAFDPAENSGDDVKIWQGEFQFREMYHGWWPQFVMLNRIGSGDADGIKIEVYSDGRVRYLEERNVVVQSTMELRKFPFDEQTLVALIVPFGYSTDQVVLKVDPAVGEASEDYAKLEKQVSLAEWKLKDVHSEVETVERSFYGKRQEISKLSLLFTMERVPGHTVWDVLFPLIILVCLMWSVFWVDSHKLTDRLNIAFIGILTIVAYQFLIDGSLPRIPYFTFTDAVVFISFLIMSIVVMQSLLLWFLHKRKMGKAAHIIDQVSLWSFPFLYAGLILASYVIYVL